MNENGTDSRISDPSISLHQRRRAKIFILVPPIGWARGGAAGTENAFIHAIEFATVFW